MRSRHWPAHASPAAGGVGIAVVGAFVGAVDSHSVVAVVVVAWASAATAEYPLRCRYTAHGLAQLDLFGGAVGAGGGTP